MYGRNYPHRIVNTLFIPLITLLIVIPAMMTLFNSSGSINNVNENFHAIYEQNESEPQ